MAPKSRRDSARVEQEVELELGDANSVVHHECAQIASFELVEVSRDRDTLGLHGLGSRPDGTRGSANGEALEPAERPAKRGTLRARVVESRAPADDRAVPDEPLFDAGPRRTDARFGRRREELRLSEEHRFRSRGGRRRGGFLSVQPPCHGARSYGSRSRPCLSANRLFLRRGPETPNRPDRGIRIRSI